MKEISLNQTLHGYSDGHTLITSSFELPADVRRLMLLLSDMSGSRMENGFEEYLTGYPIKELNVYAFAKTWYAPEMKRPGCVWTHTILIDFQHLPKIKDFYRLQEVFVRPEPNKINKESYAKAIIFQPEIIRYETTITSLQKNFEHSKILLKNLYEDDEQAVFIGAPNSIVFSDLVLAIWKQQWPRLKRNFSFCTGSISVRHIKGRPFDLQVVPSAIESVLATKGFKIIQSSSPELSQNDEWLNFLQLDLFRSSNTAHTFFNFYGSDIETRRKNFKVLVETYLFLESQDVSLERCVTMIAQNFPDPKEAVNLKNAILGEPQKAVLKFMPRFSSIKIIEQLSITKDFAALDYDKLNYFERFHELLRPLSLAAIEVMNTIIKKTPNVKGEEAMREMALSLHPADLSKLYVTNKSVFYVLVSLNPSIAFTNQFWQIADLDATEIIYQLKNVALDNKSWKKIVGILVTQNMDIDLNIFDDLKIPVVSYALDQINKERITIDDRWARYFKNHQPDVLNWLLSNDNTKLETVEIVVEILNPNSESVFQQGLNKWVSILSYVDLHDIHLLSIDIHVFCITLALNTKTVEGQLLTEFCFESVYNAIATERLGYRRWRLLEIHTKPLPFWNEWDKCKKFTIAIVDKYIREHWDIRTLIEKINSNDIREVILKQYKKRR